MRRRWDCGCECCRKVVQVQLGAGVGAAIRRCRGYRDRRARTAETGGVCAGAVARGQGLQAYGAQVRVQALGASAGAGTNGVGGICAGVDA